MKSGVEVSNENSKLYCVEWYKIMIACHHQYFMYHDKDDY